VPHGAKYGAKHGASCIVVRIVARTVARGARHAAVGALAVSVGGALAADPPAAAPAAATQAAVPAGDLAWMMASTALVLLMVVGLAFFYGGLVRRKNVLNTMMMSFVALGVVGLTFAAVGYSLAFAPGSAWLGGFAHAFLRGLGTAGGSGLPALLGFAFQATFAMISAALISGAVVERMRFGAYMLVIALWSVVVYAPLAKWVWGGGFLQQLGALDFAGGTVVHINAGVAAAVLAVLLGRRRDYGRKAMLPHQVPYTLLGAGLLWFGWFGFNAGSAQAADATAVLAFVNTLLAPAATLVVWALFDMARGGRVTAVGIATGMVVGLVAITPAAGFVGPSAALAIGALAALPSYLIMLWRARSRLDDALDVFAAHGVGGISGALLTGVFASRAWGAPVDGSLTQLGIQALAVTCALVFSAVGTLAVAGLVGLLTPLRADADTEAQGLDVGMHGEEAYTDGEGALLLPAARLEPRPPGVTSPAGSEA
jgi:Amt family ammonium transporter